MLRFDKMGETDTIVLYPSPLRGHVVSTIELAKLIRARHPHLSVTVLLSSPPPLPTSSSITFHHLPTTVPDSFAPSDRTHFDLAICNSSNLRRTLADISATTNLRALIIDIFCDAAFRVAAASDIPTYYFFTSGAATVAAFLYLPTLHEATARSFKDLGDQLVKIPGLPLMRAPDMPNGMRDRSRRVYERVLEASNNMVSCSGIIVNTCDSLEARAVGALRQGLCVPNLPTPPIFTVGPIVESKDVAGGDNSMLKTRQSKRHACLTWLDSQPQQSVVFLCFGSMGRFGGAQLMEMAMGLERTGKRFLWVVRPPPPHEDDDDFGLQKFLPEGFLERTRERGMVVRSWAPQIDVLSHDSVGGFVTHCGWNSVLEAVCAGVPMVAWPLYAEQKLNRAFLVEEARVAIPVSIEEDGFVSGAELEQRVTELMDSEIGREMRERVRAAREVTVEAAGEGGSSRASLAELAELFCGRRSDLNRVDRLN